MQNMKVLLVIVAITCLIYCKNCLAEEQCDTFCMEVINGEKVFKCPPCIRVRPTIAPLPPSPTIPVRVHPSSPRPAPPRPSIPVNRSSPRPQLPSSAPPLLGSTRSPGGLHGTTNPASITQKPSIGKKPVDNKEYCKLSCGGDPQGSNTMCKYDCSVLSASCPPGSKLLPNPPKVRQHFVDVHNEIRNDLAMGRIPDHPNAANMMRLAYDLELERIAECWASQCTWAHDKCRQNLKGENLGQNLAMKSSFGQIESDTKDSLANASMDGWKEEYKYMPPGEIDSFSSNGLGGKIAHWTAMAWATATRVGCARIHMPAGGMNKLHIVCNYGAGINLLGKPVYEKGVKCSKCPTVCDSDYEGLCANDLKDEFSD